MCLKIFPSPGDLMGDFRRGMRHFVIGTSLWLYILNFKISESKQDCLKHIFGGSPVNIEK